MAKRDIDFSGIGKFFFMIILCHKTICQQLRLTINAPIINNVDRMIVMHKLTIKIIFITDFGIISSKIYWN